MSGETTTCQGCGSTFEVPAIGEGGAAVCPACGAPQGAGPAPDDTAAFQRYYAGQSAQAPRAGRGGWLARLLGRG